MILNGYKIYEIFDEELKPYWEELFSKGMGYNLSYSWCKLWWESFSNGKKPYIYTFWENKKLKLLAPFYLKGKRLFLIGTKPDIYDEFNVLYENPLYLDKFVDYLASCPYEAGFKHLNSSSEFAKRLINKFSGSGILTVSPVSETKNRIIEKIKQESAIKSDIKRCEKNLEKDFNDEFILEFSVSKQPEFIDEFIKFHKNRWGGGMLVKKANLENFVREVFFKDENMLLSRLYLKNSGETAAYCYGYIDSASTYWLSMTAHNNKYRKFAPGKVILYKLINHLKEKNISILDFGRGSENYKNEFSDYQDVLFNLFTYKNSRAYIKTRNFIDKILRAGLVKT